VGRRLLTGLTSTIRSKSGYSKHGVVPISTPTIFTTSEEATSDSSFSGDLTETCTSEPLQELYCNSDVDSDREGCSGYERSPRSSNHSTGYRATITSGARSSQTDSDSGDNKTTKKSLKSLFRSTTSSKRGSTTDAGDYTVQEKVTETIYIVALQILFIHFLSFPIYAYPHLKTSPLPLCIQTSWTMHGHQRQLRQRSHMHLVVLCNYI
jgi:hypothetical protein